MSFQRGDLVLCALAGDFGKPGPAVVVQYVLFYPTLSSVTVWPVTTHCIDAPLFRIGVEPDPGNGLRQPSQVMVDKVTAIRTERVREVIGALNQKHLRAVDVALRLWLDLEVSA